MSVFRFKQFTVKQENGAMKVGTDAMLLGSVVNAIHARRILDIGAGTGVIALMAAQRFSEANVSAIEVDEAAAFEALENFENSPWKDRLSLIHANFLEHTFTEQFDLIVSNPPYYQTRLENDDPRKSQARHESALPMVEMLKKVQGMLTGFGSFWVIVPAEIWKVWIDSAEKAGLKCIGRNDVYGKRGGSIKRVILEFALSSLEIEPQEMIHTAFDGITVRNSDGTYTKQYIELTRDFHFKSLK